MELTSIEMLTEEGLLDKMEAICEETGIGMGYAFYLFASQFVENGGFPFEMKKLEPDYEYFESEEEAMEFIDALSMEVLAGDLVEIRLPIEVHESLLRRSKAEGKSLDELILNALESSAK